VAELSSGCLARSYTWGPDLSGSLQGAGGIGGLVFVRDSSTSGSYYPAYDGNGNLTAMVSSSTGAAVAKYEYSPYGELLTSTGSYASTNPFRFSTKYVDSETNLAYFGYRYYNPETGRWLNRDPIGEEGSQIIRRVNNGYFGKGEYDLEVLDNYNINIRGGCSKISKNLGSVIAADYLRKELVYLYVHNAPQDKIDLLGLDCPGCDGIPDFLESEGKLRVCAQHDECYDKNGCTADSWKRTLNILACRAMFPLLAPVLCGSFNDCDKCNYNAISGFVNPFNTGNTGNEYYCAKEHKYINIPSNDFPNKECADKKCCTN
jgi:RHS repeat-associated protein